MSRLEQKYRPFELQRESTEASQTTAPTYEKVPGSHRGFIQPTSGGETSAFNSVREAYSHQLYTASRVILYGDRVIQDGVTWRVVSRTQPKGISGVDHHREISLQYV